VRSRLHGFLVDGLRIRRIELLVLGVLVIAQSKNYLVRFSGLEHQFHMVAADGDQPWAWELDDLPRSTATGLSSRATPEESLAPCVEAAQRIRASKPGEMIASLAILSLVIADFVFISTCRC